MGVTKPVTKQQLDDRAQTNRQALGVGSRAKVMSLGPGTISGLLALARAQHRNSTEQPLQRSCTGPGTPGGSDGVQSKEKGQLKKARLGLPLALPPLLLRGTAGSCRELGALHVAPMGTQALRNGLRSNIPTNRHCALGSAAHSKFTSYRRPRVKPTG